MKLLKGVIAPLSENLRPTTRLLMTWWAKQASPLKRLALSIEPGQTPRKILFSQVGFPTMPKLL